jgi:acyl-CoA reductase-like NAD-dependent aldehyde dehydrogenase
LLKQFSESEMKEDVLFQANGVIKKTFLEPMGTVLALLPWDFPVLETVNIVVPAILAGNSVLLKDNPDTPTIANHFEKALEQLSPGVA